MSADKPEISIVVPAYNAGPYLTDCLESIIRQTFSDWELIITDDGSSDGTGNIADAFAANDGRIRVLHLAKQGVSDARNSGLDTARGNFIAFVDSDDVLEPEYLKELYSTRCKAVLTLRSVHSFMWMRKETLYLIRMRTKRYIKTKMIYCMLISAVSRVI